MKGVDNKGVIDRVGERVGKRVKVIHRWNSGGLAGYRSRLQVNLDITVIIIQTYRGLV